MYSDLEDLVSLLVLGPLSMIDDGVEYHDFVWSEDGDGWNEPYSDNFSCACGNWDGPFWCQTDPQCSGRPGMVEVALLWRQHILRDVWKTDEDEDQLRLF